MLIKWRFFRLPKPIILGYLIIITNNSPSNTFKPILPGKKPVSSSGNNTAKIKMKYLIADRNFKFKIRKEAERKAKNDKNFNKIGSIYKNYLKLYCQKKLPLQYVQYLEIF